MNENVQNFVTFSARQHITSVLYAIARPRLSLCIRVRLTSITRLDQSKRLKLGLDNFTVLVFAG